MVKTVSTVKTYNIKSVIENFTFHSLVIEIYIYILILYMEVGYLFKKKYKEMFWDFISRLM